jgi:hypothetical protein
MKLGELIDEVGIIIKDDSFSRSDITKSINSVISEVSSLIDIPSLKRIAVINTLSSQSYTDLSTLSGGFDGRLSIVHDSGNNFNEINIFPNLISFLDKYPDLSKTGNIEAVTLEGNVLWYQKLSTTTLQALYYSTIPMITDENEEINECFPEFIQLILIASGAAYYLFNKIEDGIEGEKVNTNSQFWMSLSTRNPDSGFNKYRKYLERRKVHCVTSTWRY